MSVLYWFDKVLDSQTDKLVQEGKISVKRSKYLLINNKYMVCPVMMEDAIKLKGLKNFLEEFSRIDDKEAIEVIKVKENDDEEVN